MTYIVAVRWTAKEGEADEIARALGELEAPTLAEAGVLEWRPHRDPESPETFFIFEVYADAGAYQAHTRDRPLRRVGRRPLVPAPRGARRESRHSSRGAPA